MDERGQGEMWQMYWRLIGARIRARMQYRLSCVTDIFAFFVVTGVEFAGMLVIFSQTSTLKGWNLAETALLYGLTATSFAMAELFGSGFDYFHLYIREGRFDRVLIRPMGAFFQVLTEEFSMKRIGLLAQGVAITGVAFWATGMLRGPLRALLFLPVITGGALFFLALFITQATTAFWTVESLEVFNILTNGGNEVLSHPLDVYHPWLQRFFLFILPMAFINYVPAAAVLGKPIAGGLAPWVAWFSPLAGVGAFGLAALFWRFGVRHYQSTGS